MANHNRVTLIGRLTRDPEVIAGGKGVKFGFAVNNRRKDDKGLWQDEPCFLDCELWNREPSNQATRLAQTVSKGGQLFLEGRLRMDSWDDKATGTKRSKVLVVVETFQYLDPPKGGNGGGHDNGVSYAAGGDDPLPF